VNLTSPWAPARYARGVTPQQIFKRSVSLAGIMTQNSAFVLFVIMVAACQDDDAQSSHVTVRDSAGIQIVENATDLWNTPLRWRASAEPIVRIGAVEGEEDYLFDGVRRLVFQRMNWTFSEWNSVLSLPPTDAAARSSWRDFSRRVQLSNGASLRPAVQVRRVSSFVTPPYCAPPCAVRNLHEWR
jgi:hypothetical protein